MDKRTVRFEPGKKISETFLEFAAPLLADLPSEDREIKARYALIMAFTAWNAVIFADVLNVVGTLTKSVASPRIDLRQGR